MRIAIIGPGLMPIPPTGWGAIEILVWDYYCALTKLGHQVIIVNTTNPHQMINEVSAFKPDVTHIQYDDYAGLANEFAKYSKIVCLTSHYAYLEQPQRGGGARLIKNCNNVYYFCLSETIANMYKMSGASPERVIITPNGANETLFAYKSTPLYPDRSIYLAKIDYRKRQCKFTGINSLYFAGNHADANFPKNHSTYLGEWTKEVLYNNLTDFGNLVLLSDGEADPLVTKEALICGLGVVISQFATANLDITKPYITVIPEHRINDLTYVEQAIIKNRIYSVQHREEIRDYGLTKSWDKIVANYSNMLETLLQK